MNKVEELEKEIKSLQNENVRRLEQIKINEDYNLTACNAINRNNNLIREKRKELEELQKQSKKRWRADKGELYWIVDSYGNIYSEFERRSSRDDYLYRSGNYYKTQQQAERAKFEMLFLQKLKDFALENNQGEIDWKCESQFKYYVDADIKYQELQVCTVCTTKSYELVYFTSREIAYNAINTFRSDFERLYLRED